MEVKAHVLDRTRSTWWEKIRSKDEMDLNLFLPFHMTHLCQVLI